MNVFDNAVWPPPTFPASIFTHVLLECEVRANEMECGEFGFSIGASGISKVTYRTGGDFLIPHRCLELPPPFCPPLLFFFVQHPFSTLITRCASCHPSPFVFKF